MPIAPTIRAQVVDVHQDKPRATDNFLVDSNVWLYMFYSRFSSDHSKYQAIHYPRYLKAVRAAKAHLYKCELSFSEVGSIIEKTEHELFKVSNSQVTAKEFRHNFPSERQDVVD